MPLAPLRDDVLAERVEFLTACISNMQNEMNELKEQVKILEQERQWWRHWHIKWGPFFRRWRDGAAGAAGGAGGASA